jgi:glycosyltransferase involved in cell wall biosynthesis
LVSPGNPRALADAVTAALADPYSIRTRAVRVQSEVRQRFSLDAMIDQALASYHEALMQAAAHKRRMSRG